MRGAARRRPKGFRRPWARQTEAVLYTMLGTCKHLGIDPFTYLRGALPGLFALGERQSVEELAEWLPNRGLLRRARGSAGGPAATG